MGQLLLFIVVALVVATIVFGVTVMMGGGDSGLTPVEPDGRALPLPSDRPLGEEDVIRTRFDTALRGYRMSQVDQALQRAAYDIGYKGELIGVLEAEVTALREGRMGDADVLRRAREAAVAPAPDAEAPNADAPKTDAPKTDAPSSDAPSSHAPKTDAPEVDASTPGERPAEVVADVPAGRSAAAWSAEPAVTAPAAKDPAPIVPATKDPAPIVPAVDKASAATPNVRAEDTEPVERR